MQTYSVRQLKKNCKFTVSVPGSKSITNRALLIAALANGKTKLKGTLFSDDSRYFLSSLISLGFDVLVDEKNKEVTVIGLGGNIPKDNAEIYVGSAGTAARFLTCMCGLSDGTYVINASEQMQRRPMKPLLMLLKNIGAKVEFLGEEYHLPVRITGVKKVKEFECLDVDLDISSSTQFLSALLLAGTMLDCNLNIHITSEKKYGSYIGITMDMMKEFGIEAKFNGDTYSISKGSKYNPMEYQIEPDVSAACYFFGIAALTESEVIVKNIREDSTQGDIRFLSVLKDMGCEVEFIDEGVKVVGPTSKLKGINIDMNNFSDQTMTLASIAVFADSPTKITGISHIRLQESDRLTAIVNELTKMGIKTEHGEDFIVIYPGTPNATTVSTYEDHRMAMAFTLVGLVAGNIIIDNPLCCKKTFEEYFDVIDDLCNKYN